MSLHQRTVPHQTDMLRALSGQLEKAESLASAGGGDRSALMAARLAPDMHPLSTQVRFTCLQALECMDYLTGKPARPVDAVREVQTIEAAQELIAHTIQDLEAADPQLWSGAEDRAVEIDLSPIAIFDMTGAQYVRDWALPQFSFHLITAYAIMRMSGVAIGKEDYLPHMFAYARRQPA